LPRRKNNQGIYMKDQLKYFTLLLALAAFLTPANLYAEGAMALQHMGPTGIQGYISGKRVFTIKTVDKGSPADGKLWPGDQVVGAGRMPFLKRVRVEFGAAIAQARTTKNKGRLVLMVRRKTGGKKMTRLTLQLGMVGPDTFNKTAPYNCPKTEAMIKEAADYIVSKKARGPFGRLNVGLLGLLATGEDQYIKFVGEHLHTVDWATGKEGSLGGGYVSWYWGYKMLVLTEYYLLTQDKYVLPAIRLHAEAAAAGQDAAGIWGHRMHDPRTGRAFGYGVMNQPSLPLYISMVLARKCGVDSPRIKAAVLKTTEHYKRKYVHKGTLPYGNGPANSKGYNNNGMSGSLAVAFANAGEIEGARFFARMAIASYNDLETGHATHFFNFLWSGLGVNVAGPEAASAFFKKVSYFYSMKVDWNGGYTYEQDKGEGLGNTGAYLLNLCAGRNKIHITGKDYDKAIKLNTKEVAESINVHKYLNTLNKMGIEELFEVYDTHWSPLIRRIASWKMLKFKREDLLAKINVRRKTKPNSLIGLGRFWDKNPEEFDKVAKILHDQNASLGARIGAAGVLGGAAWSRYIEPEEKFGKKEFYGDANLHLPAVKYFADLMKVVADDEKNDPYGMLDEAAGNAMASLGDPYKQKLIKDKVLFYKAINKMLIHKHSSGLRGKALKMLAYSMPVEDLHYVAENVMIATKGTDRSFSVYRGGAVTENGVLLLNRLNIQEAVEVCLESFPTATRGKERGRRLQLFLSFGANAKPYLPRLKAMLNKDFEKKPDANDEAKDYDNTKNVSLKKGEIMDFIKKIEASKSTGRKMISLKEAIAKGKE
jgi:hypothetical protein